MADATRMACLGADTTPCRLGGFEHAEQCKYCGIKVRRDMVDDKIFGFKAGCEHAKKGTQENG